MTTPPPVVLPGQLGTADAFNRGFLIGRVVFYATRAAAQSITTGAPDPANALAWDTVDLNLLTGWDAGAATRWTCPLAGWWTLAGGVSFNASTSGTIRESAWYRNGSLVTGGRSRPVVSSAITGASLTVAVRTIPILLAVGDYIQLVPGQDTGGALNTATGSAVPFMSATYSGPA